MKRMFTKGIALDVTSHAGNLCARIGAEEAATVAAPRRGLLCCNLFGVRRLLRLSLSILLGASVSLTAMAGNVYTASCNTSVNSGEMPAHLKKMVPAIRSAIGATNTVAKFTRGKPVTIKFSSSSGDANILDTNNFVECNIRVTCLSDRLLRFMMEHKCVVISKSIRFRAIHAKVPVSFLEQLAKDEEVVIIKDVKPIKFHKTNTSEGDVGHKAASARSLYGVTGNGVKVGVMSDSERYLDSTQDSGDLPSNVQILASGIGTAVDK